jgi:hypothetical protein
LKPRGNLFLWDNLKKKKKKYQIITRFQSLKEIRHMLAPKMRWERQNKRWDNMCQRLVAMPA